MKRLMVRTGLVLLLFSTESHAQSGTVNLQADAGRASQASCVILKRMGRIDRTKSRLSSFGIRGKQFRYVEGKLPAGYSPHHKMTDHDVRNLQARGAQVLVLDSDYTSEDLQEARANCQRESVKMPNQVEAKASPPPTAAPNAGTTSPAQRPLTAKATSPKAGDSASFPGTAEPAGSSSTPATKTPAAMPPAPKAEGSASSEGARVAALIDVSSTPPGADVYIDERFFGHTPATTIILMPGNHKFTVKKEGFIVWKKKLNLPSGHINVDAELVRKAK